MSLGVALVFPCSAAVFALFQAPGKKTRANFLLISEVCLMRLLVAGACPVAAATAAALLGGFLADTGALVEFNLGTGLALVRFNLGTGLALTGHGLMPLFQGEEVMQGDPVVFAELALRNAMVFA